MSILQHMFPWRSKKNIMWLSPLIWRYVRCSFNKIVTVFIVFQENITLPASKKLLINTYNLCFCTEIYFQGEICFHREIRKLFIWKPDDDDNLALYAPFNIM